MLAKGKRATIKQEKLQKAQRVLFSNKCLKSLELMAQSLRKVENNIKGLSSYPGFEVNLNLISLLTLNVENQHAVTHFKKETVSTNTHRFLVHPLIKK